jgi:tetratricopeptide (TPR) repeat protein
MKRVLGTVLLVCLLVSPADAADKWLSIRSKNFLAIGTASEDEIRRVDRFLEEYRKAFALLFPKIEQSVGTPTTVVVFKNDEYLKPFKPIVDGAPVSGSSFFLRGDDVSYIATTGAFTSRAPVLHDYAHLVAREASGGLPLWIMEGLAECLSTFEPEKKANEFTLGRVVDSHIATLSMTPLLPFKELFAQDQGSFYYNEGSRQGIFYAESWALMHYMLFGPNSSRRPQLAQFISLVAGAAPIEDSFVEAFVSDYPTLEEEFRDYVRQPWPTVKIVSNDDLRVDVRSMVARTLSEAESEYYLGDLLLHMNRLPEAETHLKNAVAKDPTLTNAKVSLGLLRARDKNFEDAVALLKQAVDSQPNNAMVNFYYADILQRMGGEQGYETIHTYVNKSITQAPRFTEAYGLLARVNLVAGKNLDESESMLKKAFTLSPGRQDLRMLLAQTYLRANRTADAGALLRDLARVTTDPEVRNTAKTLLDQLTPDQPVFTEILPEVPRENLARGSLPEAPLPEPKPIIRQDTVIQPLTPIGPTVQGEKISGLLIQLDCSNGLTLRVRTDRTTLDLHSSEPEKIQFLSYTSEVTDNIKCGPRNPGTPVSVTYRPVQGGLGDPLVVEFTGNK